MEWIAREVNNGLKKLYSLRLDRTPAADTVASTIQMWAESVERHLGLNTDHQVDTVRIREGFDRLVDSAKQWPSPAMLYEVMPSRSEGRFSRGKRQQFIDLSDKELLEIESMTVEEKHLQAKKAMGNIYDILEGKVVNQGVEPNEKARNEQVAREGLL